MSSSLSSSKRERGLSLEMLQRKRASSSMQGRISWFVWSYGGKLSIPLELRVDLGDRSCLLREVRSPLSLRGAPWDSSRITAGMNRASYRVEAGTSGFLSISDFDPRVSADWNPKVRPRIVLRNGTPLASGVLPRVTGHLLSFIWNLRLFPENTTRLSVPLRVVTSFSGLHSKRCPGIGTYLEWTGKSVSFGMWHDPRGFLSSFNVRPASS